MMHCRCPRLMGVLAGVCLGLQAWGQFPGLAPAAGGPPDPRLAVRAELLKHLFQLLQPLTAEPAEGKAWRCEARVTLAAREGTAVLSWDGRGRGYVHLLVKDEGEAKAGFTPSASWLAVPRHKVLFRGSRPEGAAAAGPLLEGARVWPLAREQFGLMALGAGMVPLPKGLALERQEEGLYIARDANGKWEVLLDTQPEKGVLSLVYSRNGKTETTVSLPTWQEVDAAELDRLLEPPTPARTEPVADADLRAMLTTLADMLCEKGLWQLNTGSLPPPTAALPQVAGKAVVVLRGTPQEIGRQYGAVMKEAVLSNMHRILHGMGLLETVRSGAWFPKTLEATFNRQRPFIPDRYVEEMTALAQSVGVKPEWVYATNQFPELFHCSGFALRGTATAKGQLLHGRILDYMTEIGLQSCAVITVVAPTGRHAWVNIGYAGCIGTVTAMNEKGLAMGEMGGGGNGHLDGMPMTLLMREVMERFETTDQALEWLRATPRTCEYYYVLSDAKTGNMAGVVALARSLAAERQLAADLQVIRAGETHPQLPNPIPDTVLMSAGDRYRRLSERVRAHQGQITPVNAWELMGQGVAMNSALHLALFLPESLDFWVADAGLNGRAAYTQPVAKLNLRTLLATPLPAP